MSTIKPPRKDTSPRDTTTPLLSAPKFVSEKELAERLGLGVQFIRKCRDRGDPPYYSKFGRRARCPIAEVERYEAAAFVGDRKPVNRLPDGGSAR
jgi:hypothetical protein